MPATTTFIGAPFGLQSVIQLNASTLRVTFSRQPTITALDPANYGISGLHAANIVGVEADADPYSVVVSLSSALAPGEWILSVQNIESGEPAAVVSDPVALTFDAQDFTFREPSKQPAGMNEYGLENDSTEEIIRKHLPPLFRSKKGWNALIAALAEGDRLVQENNRLAFDQLFKASAKGKYLVQRAADDGVLQPAGITLDEDVFRRLSIKITASKLVNEALLEILEIFYGSESTRPYADTATGSPFALEDGSTLDVLVDESQLATITFRQEDFGNIAAATAEEIAAVITRTFSYAKLTAFAVPVTVGDQTKVRIYSGALGLRGSVRVTGGKAQNALLFPNPVNVWLWAGGASSPVCQWDVTQVDGVVARYKVALAGGGVAPYNLPNLSLVRDGDYVNVYGAGFDPANRGSFKIVNVHIEYNGSTPVQWIDVENPGAKEQSGAQHTQVADVLFYRPIRRTVASNFQPSLAAQHTDGSLDVILPATAKAVTRTEGSAIYGQGNAPIAIDTFTRTADGLVVVDTKTDVPLAQGATFKAQVYGVECDYSRSPNSGQYVIEALDATVVGPRSVSIETQVKKEAHGVGGHLLIVTAQPGTIKGPYLVDPANGVAVTAIESETTQPLSAGRRYSALGVTDSSVFPDEPGWIVVGFGTHAQLGPIHYLVRLDGQNLVLDKIPALTVEIPAGAKVTLLAQKGAWTPARPQDIGCAYVTASSAGRLAAEAFIDLVLATGVTVNKRVLYPGDTGLGRAGKKVSDRVMVWAGDDVAAEVEEAFNG